MSQSFESMCSVSVFCLAQGSRLDDQRCAAPPPPTRGPTVPDDDFFSLILRSQAKRIDEQRVILPPDQSWLSCSWTEVLLTNQCLADNQTLHDVFPSCLTWRFLLEEIHKVLFIFLQMGPELDSDVFVQNKCLFRIRPRPQSRSQGFSTMHWMHFTHLDNWMDLISCYWTLDSDFRQFYIYTVHVF